MNNISTKMPEQTKMKSCLSKSHPDTFEGFFSYQNFSNKKTPQQAGL
jgi:hypothetical protein